MVSGVSFKEAATCILYLLMFNCRDGSWYVMCAKSVAVTFLCMHCFDKNFVFLGSYIDERDNYYYFLQLTKCNSFMCFFLVSFV